MKAYLTQPINFFTAYRLWREPVHILGGGPSMSSFDVTSIPPEHRIIAINNAGLDIAPHADILYWSDHRWLEWNLHRLPDFRGGIMLTRTVPRIHVGALKINVIRYDKSLVLSTRPDTIAGHDSGSSCINLAWLLGAKTIYLHGFDMRPGNYHNDHKISGVEEDYVRKFFPVHEAMARELARAGAIVYNATPNSALTAYPSIAW